MQHLHSLMAARTISRSLLPVRDIPPSVLDRWQMCPLEAQHLLCLALPSSAATVKVCITLLQLSWLAQFAIITSTKPTQRKSIIISGKKLHILLISDISDCIGPKQNFSLKIFNW